MVNISIQVLLSSGDTCNLKRRKGMGLVLQCVAAGERQIPTARFLRAHVNLTML